MSRLGSVASLHAGRRTAHLSSLSRATPTTHAHPSPPKKTKHPPRQCRDAGAVVEVEVVIQGRRNQDISESIVAKVEELGAAMVVMPEQRQTLFESFFFQTPVAQQVAQRCKRPTVLIR